MVPMETDSDDIEVIKTNILITSFVHNGNNIKTYNLINLHLVITSLSKIKTKKFFKVLNRQEAFLYQNIHKCKHMPLLKIIHTKILS
jgi:hypothetical protein